MKRIIIAALCLLILVSCASSSSTSRVEKDREIAEAVYQEGKAYLSQKRYSIALGRFLEAEKIIKDDRFLQYDIGFTYYLKDEYNLAEQHFKKSLELKPDFMPAMNALGTMYLKQKQWDKAIKALQESADSLLYASSHYSFINLGWAYFGKKDYESSKINFLKAMEKSPNSIKALHGLAIVSLKTKNDEDIVIKKLHKALKKFPKVMIINYDLAIIYESIGQHSKAKKFWEEVLHLASEGSEFYEEAENKLSGKN